MNPMEMIKNFIGKGLNPQQILNSMMNNNNNLVLSNLIQKAKQGDTKGVEDFARNLFKEQGRDFDKEYSQFKNSFKK